MITKSPSHSNFKKNLRTKIRIQRKALSPLQQKVAKNKLKKNLDTSLFLLKARHIALYLGADGEICPKDLIKHYLKRKKCLYLPVLHPFKHDNMIFCRINEHTRFIANRFGILEPDFKRSQHLPPTLLSLVLMPLVAFDAYGNRMGMGGGFYDRTFEFKRFNNKHLPRLVGLAHDFQKQERLPTEEWDIPLFAIFTDKKIYHTRKILQSR